MTKISVIIPFCNRIEWLEEAIESVLSQTFEDFEIILINDGSTENFSLERMLRDPRIRYLEQDNHGASNARNRGIDVAKGEFIAFLDSDDLFVPEKLRIQLEFMEARPEFALTYTSYERIDSNGHYIESIRSGADSFNKFPLLFLNCSIALPTVMIRRDVIRQSGIHFDDSISIGEDIIYWASLAEKYPIAGVDEALTKVRIHGSNAANDPKAQLVANEIFIEFIRKNVRSTRAIRKLKSDIYINCFFHSLFLSHGISKLVSIKYVVKCLANDPFNSRFWREPQVQLRKFQKRGKQ